MGNPFIGIIHPCKIYNILSTGTPILYIGPRPSHVSEMLESMNGTCSWASVAHGQVEEAAHQIKSLRDRGATTATRAAKTERQFSFSKGAILPRFIAELESIRV
jgi:hypothetical protein